MTATRQELLDLAIDLIIKPQKADRERCLQQVFDYEQSRPWLMELKTTTAGEIRDEIEKYKAAAKRFLHRTKPLRSASRLLDSQAQMTRRVEADLHAIIRLADILIAAIQVERSGNKRQDWAAVVAARWAHNLLEIFSSQKPSKTTDGPFQHLTCVIYEYLVGRKPPNVERICDAVFDEIEAERRDKQAQK